MVLSRKVLQTIEAARAKLHAAFLRDVAKHMEDEFPAEPRASERPQEDPVALLDGLDSFLDVLRGQLLAADPELLGLYPTDTYVRHLDAQPWQLGYGWIGV